MIELISSIDIVVMWNVLNVKGRYIRLKHLEGHIGTTIENRSLEHK